MEVTIETRDPKRPLKVYVTPTDAIERQALVPRGWQPAVRSLCALGLVLSLSASLPLSVLSADTSTHGGDSPVLRGAITPTEAGESSVPHTDITPTEDGASPVLRSTITPPGGGKSPVSDSNISPTGGDKSPVSNNNTTPTKGSESRVLRSTITQTDPNSPIVNTGDVRVVAPGTMLDLALSTEIEAGENVEGDGFFCKITKDVLVDGQVVIPRGTVVHGVLSTLEEPKRGGRNGYITTRFDYLITPDGREVPIEGNSTTRDSKGKAAARVLGRAAGYTAIGGAVGTLMVLQLGGLSAAAASYGSAPAGGAAIGGAAGLTIAMLTKGKSVLLRPGTEMHVQLSEPLRLPTMIMPDETAEDFSIPGLNVKVAGMRTYGMTEVTLTLDILNETDYTFSKYEIGLEDEMGNVFFPTPFGVAGMWYSKIGPGGNFKGKITFSVDNVKSRYKLVFFKPFSREPLAKFALTDAMLAGGKASPKSKHVVTEAG